MFVFVKTKLQGIRYLRKYQTEEGFKNQKRRELEGDGTPDIRSVAAGDKFR